MSIIFLHLTLYVDTESFSQFKGMTLLSTYSRFYKQFMPTFLQHKLNVAFKFPTQTNYFLLFAFDSYLTALNRPNRLDYLGLAFAASV